LTGAKMGLKSNHLQPSYNTKTLNNSYTKNKTHSDETKAYFRLSGQQTDGPIITTGWAT